MNNPFNTTFALLWLLVLSMGCGSWLGNPRDFGGNDDKKNVPTPEEDRKQPVFLSVSGYANGTLSSKNSEGVENLVTVEKIEIGLNTLVIGESSLADFGTLSIDETSKKLGEVKEGTNITDIAFEWASSSVMIVGSYQGKSLNLVLNLQDLTKSITFDSTIALTSAAIIDINLQNVFDFTGKQESFDTFVDLDFTTEDAAKANFVVGLSRRVHNNISAGFDNNGDSVLDENEKSASTTAQDDLLEEKKPVEEEDESTPDDDPESDSDD